jgi:hypothetical protein
MNPAPCCIGLNGLQPVQLARFCRDDQLAGAGMGDAVVLAIGVEPLAAIDAKPGLQAVRGIIEARMDDFRIARTRLRADRTGLFDHHHLAPGDGERPGDGEADDTGSGDNTVDALHGAAPDLASGV